MCTLAYIISVLSGRQSVTRQNLIISYEGQNIFSFLVNPSEDVVIICFLLFDPKMVLVPHLTSTEGGKIAEMLT